ncbi:MAG: hypothetical protein IKR57_04665 [Bacilli bacterium]|nr:hypothetical protein [Bacilli bacterium]
MKRRIKRKIRKLFRICLLLIILLLIIYIIIHLICRLFKKSYSSDTVNVVKTIEEKYLDFDITTKSEKDIQNIDYYFMEGMKTSDFKEILREKNNSIISNDKYKKIKYNFERVLHYFDIEEILKELNNSESVKLEIIGKSVDNRNIYGIEIGSGEDVLFLDANIHAAEVSTTYILIKFLIDVVNLYERGNTDVNNLLNNIKIVAIPCINPDGYEVYNYGIDSIRNKDLYIYKNKDKIDFNNIKSNANGVDLNRNFPTQNSGLLYKGKKLKNNTSIDITTERGKYFNGYSVGSEPEVKSVIYYMLKYYKNIYAYINLHSQGRVIYYGKPNLSKDFNKVTEKFASRISSITSYKLNDSSYEEVGEGNDGSATDFMSELANGFIFSEITGRLSTNKYKNNNCKLVYNYPVITMEVTKDWTSNPSYFKSEYNNYVKKALFEILEK